MAVQRLPLHNFSLRPVREEDRLMLWKWRNSERVRRHMFNPHPIPWPVHVEWFRALTRDETRRFWVLEGDGRPLGACQSARAEPERGGVRWGFYVGEPGAPRGTGTALGFLALTALFDEQRTERVWGEVLPLNRRSRRFHERFGFSLEGRQAQRLLYRLDRDDWNQSKAAIGARHFADSRGEDHGLSP